MSFRNDCICFLVFGWGVFLIVLSLLLFGYKILFLMEWFKKLRELKFIKYFDGFVFNLFDLSFFNKFFNVMIWLF